MAEEITNIFKGQAAKILACYTTPSEFQEQLEKAEAIEFEKAQTAEVETTETETKEEIQKSELDVALEVLNTPFEI